MQANRLQKYRSSIQLEVCVGLHPFSGAATKLRVQPYLADSGIAIMKTLNSVHCSSIIRPKPAFKCIGKSLVAFFSASLLAVTATAQIASGTTGIDATGNTASEIAACNNGTSQQSRETCLTEARNASAARRAGQLNSGSGTLDANAAQRCDALQGDDKLACQARMAGAGTTQGSVSGGGVIREIEVVVPATTQPAPRQ